MNKVGLGGGCHWCTEGIFQSLNGVHKVEQGWIASESENSALSEAVIVHYDPSVIKLADLIEIHLYTHSSHSEHSMRNKYRSAVYYFNEKHKKECLKVIAEQQKVQDNNIITQVLSFISFKENEEKFLNYFYSRSQSQFCMRYIHPKIERIKRKYSNHVNQQKIKAL